MKRASRPSQTMASLHPHRLFAELFVHNRCQVHFRPSGHDGALSDTAPPDVVGPTDTSFRKASSLTE